VVSEWVLNGTPAHNERGHLDFSATMQRLEMELNDSDRYRDLKDMAKPFC